MTAKPKTAKQEADDNNTLILYRLALVESAVKAVSEKLDKQDNVKRSDFAASLGEVRDTIIARITDIQAGLQKQIDKKADQDQVDDLRSLVKAVAGLFFSVVAGLIVFYLTNRK